EVVGPGGPGEEGGDEEAARDRFPPRLEGTLECRIGEMEIARMVLLQPQREGAHDAPRMTPGGHERSRDDSPPGPGPQRVLEEGDVEARGRPASERLGGR